MQTTDGYLWMRTSAGLARFDGVRFVSMDAVIGDEPVKAMTMGAEGDLLIRTLSRTLVYKDGVFSDYVAAHPLPDGDIRTLFESKQHELLLGSDDFIYRIQNRGAQMLRRGTGFILGFAQDDDGTVWIASGYGLFSYSHGVLSSPLSTLAALTTHPHLSAMGLDHLHRLWLGTEDGLFRKERNSSALTRVDPNVIRGNVHALLEDRQGNLWIGTHDSGLMRMTGGHISSYSTADGLSDNKVLSLFEDREGGIWVGTGSGVDQLRDTKLTTLTTKEGLPSDDVRSAFESKAGDLYVACVPGGVVRIRGDRATQVSNGDAANYSGGAVLESRDGSIWVAANRGLVNLKDGKSSLYDPGGRFSRNYISALSEDDESLIVTTSETVAVRFKDGQIQPFTIRGQTTPLSAPGNYTFTIYRDRSGTLWFGTVQGLFKFAPGEDPMNAKQKGIDFPVTSIFDDDRGSLWLSGRTPGLTRFRLADGRVTRYLEKDGLFDDPASRVLADDDGNFWMSNSDGIYSVSRKDLDDFADGRATKVRATNFGTSDGMKTSEATPQPSPPAGWRTRDGRLWFTTTKGLVVVDPKHIRHNDLVPPVIVEDVVVNGRLMPKASNLLISPGKAEVEFHYTALSMGVPGRVMFKYRLEGYDRDWVEAGTRRVAYYTNLPPGKYRFRVIACNDDGVWNMEGASVGFDLKPHFYQTGWFYFVCGLSVLLVSVTGQRVYTRQLRSRAKELGSMVDERTKDLQAAERAGDSAEKRYRSSLEQLQLVLEAVQSGTFEIDLNTKVVTRSEELQRLYGMDPGAMEPTQEAWEACVLPNSYPGGDAGLQGTIERGGGTNEFRIRRHNDGELRWIEARTRVLYDSDGRAVRLVGTDSDVTERKHAQEENVKLEEQLRQAQKMEAVGRLAGGIAHDFNNLLMVIQSNAEMMQERLTDQPILSQDVQEILNASDRAAGLTKQLLSFSRKQVVRPTMLDLRAIVRETAVMLERLIGENVELKVDATDSLWTVSADRDQIVQVFMNLSVNARDAMPKGGVITVTTRNVTMNEDTLASLSHFVEPGDYVELSVADTGIGMSAEVREHVFDPFFTTKGLGHGTGLGLATVYAIVEQCGGYVWAESEEGKGSCFRVFLPRVKGATVTVDSAIDERCQRGTETILIAEDADSLRESISTFMRGLGYTVLGARSGEEALSIAADYEGEIEVLLTDVVMPKMGGGELSKILEGLRPRLKTIYMSGYIDEVGERSGVREKSAVFLQKPFKLATLAHKIREVIGPSLPMIVETAGTHTQM